MLALVTKALTRPAAGPIATSAALVLTAVLAASLARAGQTEGELKAQVAALAAAARANSVAWRTQLDSCRSELAQAKPPMTTAVTRVAGGEEAVAERLASQGPAGFDVCARMEAADRAVLASLDAK